MERSDIGETPFLPAVGGGTLVFRRGERSERGRLWLVELLSRNLENLGS